MLSPFRNPDFPTRSERRRLLSANDRLEKYLIERADAPSSPDVYSDGRIDPAYDVDRTISSEQFWYRSIFDS